MANVIFEIILIILLGLANGLFAMSEISVISSRKSRLENLARKGSDRARTALELANNPGTLLSTVQIGITAISVIAGAISGATLGASLADVLRTIPAISIYADFLGYTLVVISITYFTLIIGELVPKRIGLNNPEKIAIKVAPLMKILAKFGKPFVFLFNFTTEAALKFLHVRPSSEPAVTEEEIRMLIRQGSKAGIIEKAEQDILESVFRLGDKRVEAFMTPRTKITWLDVNSTKEENVKIIMESGFSNFPVCSEDLDNLLGVVRIKDIFYSGMDLKEFDIQSKMIQPLLIPEGTRALKLLERFKQSRIYIAIIIDEYGGVQGLVTITDLVEEVLGELSAANSMKSMAVQRKDGSWLVDGMISIDDFKHILHIDMLPGEEEDDFQTLGGFVMLKLEKVPTEGERFESAGYEFEIMDMDGNRVDKILVSQAKKTG
ncbi:MAG: hemolysin family protein [Bacillota bacterium]